VTDVESPIVSGSGNASGPSIRTIFTALLQADFASFLKHRRALIVSLLLPFFILITTNRGGAVNRFGGAEFLIGLAIAYALCATAIVGYALSMARDRERGVFRRLRVTPAPTWAIMTSRLMLQVLSNLIISLFVVILGTRLHHLSPSIGQYLLVLLVSILAGAVFLSIAQALVGLVRSADTLQAVARVLLAVLILLGMLGQSGALGNFWGHIATWSPVGVVMTMFAGVIDLHTWAGHQTGALAAAVGYVLICTGIGIRWFQWDAV
jgi:ABC-2 type transport system permease protein